MIYRCVSEACPDMSVVDEFENAEAAARYFAVWALDFMGCKATEFSIDVFEDGADVGVRVKLRVSPDRKPSRLLAD